VAKEKGLELESLGIDASGELNPASSKVRKRMKEQASKRSNSK
jgi:hypothetical protein